MAGKLIAPAEAFAFNAITEGSQGLSQTARLPGGGYVAIWNDRSLLGGDASGWSVQGQIFAADGSRVGGQFLVNTTTNGDQLYADVVALTNGNVVVTWHDSNPPTTMRGQVLDPAGTKIGSEFSIDRTPTSSADPDLTALSDGGFAMAWSVFDTHPGGDGNDHGVVARLFDATGTATSGYIRVNSVTAGFQVKPAITQLANGNLLITWESLNTGTSLDYDIKAQILSSSGTRIGGEFLVTTTTAGPQFSPEVSTLADGGFVIGWYDNFTSTNRAQVFDANGSRSGSEFTLAQSTAQPAFAEIGDGRFLYAWVEYDASAGVQYSRLAAQIFNRDGSFSGPQFTLVPRGPNLVSAIEVIALEASRFLVSWDAGDGAGGVDVRGQILTLDAGNTAPVIVSAGGAGIVSLTLAENARPELPYRLSATDANQDALTFRIAGGADAARFVIDAATGAVRLNQLSNFEAPTDANGDNVYEVVVAASDGTDQSLQTLLVAITDVAEGVTIFGGSGKDNISPAKSAGGQPKPTALADTIDGGAGNDRIDGGQGGDVMIGGLGDDVFVFDSLADRAIELAGQGYDTMTSFLVGLELEANVEVGTLTGSLDLDIAGNALANTLVGNAGANRLSGGGGEDLLIGGLGRDTLVGGEGIDTFRFLSLTDSTTAAPDLIVDFDFNRVDLSAIDANALARGNQAFTWVGGNEFTGTAGELRLSQTTVNGKTVWTLVGDVNGDSQADFAIQFDNDPALYGPDFLIL